MLRSISRALDITLYRIALSICPSGFRHAHADDMLRDFLDAHDEASTGRAGGLWWLRLVMAIDIVRTVSVQWARTRLPAIAFVSGTLGLALAAGTATLTRRLTSVMRTDRTLDETTGIVFLATTAVVVIAMTIVLTLWVTRLNRRRCH